MKKTKKFIYIGIFLITMALISTLYFEEEISQKITTIITVITALIGAAALFIQYKRDKEINQASFIVEYAKYFHSLPNVDELSILLEKYRLKQEATIKEEHYAAKAVRTGFLCSCKRTGSAYSLFGKVRYDCHQSSVYYLSGDGGASQECPGF